MRIAFFMAGIPGDITTPHVSFVMMELVNTLKKAGATVDLIVPESCLWDLSQIEPEYDLYVLKSKSPLSLSLASVLSAKGATFVNSVVSCQIVRDKIATEVALASKGIPVPAAWTTGQSELLQSLVDEGPLWIKDRSGSKGRGVTRTCRRDNKAFSINPTDSYGLPLPLFAQRDVSSPGHDLKVYVVDEKQWAITRPWPAKTLDDKLGSPATINSYICDTAFSCGEALGLSIYGVDFLITDNECHVVDVNAFPGFKGIENAPIEIARFLLQRISDTDLIKEELS